MEAGIGVRGYGQRDSLVEYKEEAFGLVSDMCVRRDSVVVNFFFNDTAATEIYTLTLHDALPI